MNLTRAHFIITWFGHEIITDQDGNWRIFQNKRVAFSLSSKEIELISEDELFSLLGFPSYKDRGQLYKRTIQLLNARSEIPTWDGAFNPSNIIEVEIIETFKVVNLVREIKAGNTTHTSYTLLPARKHSRIVTYLEKLQLDLDENELFFSAPVIAAKFKIELQQARFHLVCWLWDSKLNRKRKPTQGGAP